MSERLYGATISWEDASGQPAWLEFDVTTEERHTLTSQPTSHPTEAGAVVDAVVDDPDQVTLTGVVSRCPLPSSDVLASGRTAGSFRNRDISLPDVTEWVNKITKLDVPAPKLVPNAASLVGAAIDALVGGGPPEFKHYGSKKSGRSAQIIHWGYDDAKSRPAEVYLLLLGLRLARTPCRVVSPIADRQGLLIVSIEAGRNAELGTSAEFSVTLSEVRTAVAGKVVPAEPAAQKRVITSTSAKKPEGDGEPPVTPETAQSMLSKLTDAYNAWGGI